MDENATEITLYKLNCFEFEYPDKSLTDKITVRVIYWETKSEDIIAEAWLRNENITAMSFLGDVVKIENYGLSVDEVEDKIIKALNESEVFYNSVSAAVMKSTDYFTLDDDERKNDGNN